MDRGNWIALESHCENTGKQEEKDELLTITAQAFHAARKARGTKQQILSDFYGSLTKRTGSVQAVDSLPLRPHRCPLKSSSRPPLLSHPHALFAGPHPARQPATNRKSSRSQAHRFPPFGKHEEEEEEGEGNGEAAAELLTCRSGCMLPWEGSSWE